MRRIVLTAMWWVAISACTPLGVWVYEDPGFEVQRVRFQPDQETDSTVVVALLLWNPNDYDLSTARFDLKLRLDERHGRALRAGQHHPDGVRSRRLSWRCRSSRPRPRPASSPSSAPAHTGFWWKAAPPSIRRSASEPCGSPTAARSRSAGTWSRRPGTAAGSSVVPDCRCRTGPPRSGRDSSRTRETLPARPTCQCAMRSISTAAPKGNAATATVVRAG